MPKRRPHSGQVSMSVVDMVSSFWIGWSQPGRGFPRSSGRQLAVGSCHRGHVVPSAARRGVACGRCINSSQSDCITDVLHVASKWRRRLRSAADTPSAAARRKARSRTGSGHRPCSRCPCGRIGEWLDIVAAYTSSACPGSTPAAQPCLASSITMLPCSQAVSPPTKSVTYPSLHFQAGREAQGAGAPGARS